VSRRLTIIGYHNVEGTHYFDAAAGQGTRGFRQQLQLLRRTMNVVELGTAARAWAEGRDLPMRSICITFDDGYRDSLDVAAPVLEQYSLPATFFLIPAFVSRESHAWWERLSWCVLGASVPALHWQGRVIPLGERESRVDLVEELAADVKALSRSERERAVEEMVEQLAPVGEPYREDLFLDWDQSRALVRRGFEVGSHSYRHAILSRETPAEQADDLSRSKKLLESELDAPIDGLAYPNGEHGDFTTETYDALRLAGYTHAVTTIPGLNRPTTPPFELRRVVISPATGPRGLLEGLARTWKPRRA
jgi:peptidoglycan/xylan/chitin deacetylase (PgdA/CDA1 family)